MNFRGRPKGIKQSKLVFEDEKYKITEIPLNYQITVKIKKLLRDSFYSDLYRGLDYAKEIAEHMINKYG